MISKCSAVTNRGSFSGSRVTFFVVARVGFIVSLVSPTVTASEYLAHRNMCVWNRGPIVVISSFAGVFIACAFLSGLHFLSKPVPEQVSRAEISPAFFQTRDLRVSGPTDTRRRNCVAQVRRRARLCGKPRRKGE